MNLLSIGFLSYFNTKIPLGKIIFFNWLITKEYRIWKRNIFIPHVVEPAQPPINIKARNKIRGKLPQSSNCAFTYPVPVKIEITLKNIDLKSNEVELLKLRYSDKIIIDKKIIFKKVLTWVSEIKIDLFPFKNLI